MRGESVGRRRVSSGSGRVERRVHLQVAASCCGGFLAFRGRRTGGGRTAGRRRRAWTLLERVRNVVVLEPRDESVKLCISERKQGSSQSVVDPTNLAGQSHQGCSALHRFLRCPFR